MIMEAKRLFVGNLPPGVTQQELETEFNAYGHVKNVELKYKDNLVDATNPTFFAFVTIEANGQQINQCIEEFQHEKYRGRYLTISVARESFLDRLKREREEAGLTTAPVNKTEPPQTEQLRKEIPKKLPIVRNVPKLQSKAESSSSSDSESDSSSSESDAEITKKIVEPEVQIAKKWASNSIQNGKIKIESDMSAKPLHIIQKNNKINKTLLDEKGKTADMKRKESMHKMRDQYTQQKLAIQKALAAVDSNKPQKICFDEEQNNEENYNDEFNEKDHQNKMNLFDDEGDEDDDDNADPSNDFAVKQQFQGAKGQKLMKLQSKFKLDKRFEMNTKFLDDDNDDNDKRTTEMEVVEEEEDDERKWQLGIIEEVVGHKLGSLSEVNRKKLRKTMQRYDPTKQEHEKFLQNIEKVAKTIKVKNCDNSAATTDDIGQEVSKEQFYTINDNLTNSLKRRGDGFSLLSMFGRSADSTNQNDPNYEAKVLVSSHLEKPSNPFKYDSSDSEDDQIKKIDTTKPKQNNKNTNSSGGNTNQNGVWNENFFLCTGDQRLIDGAEFFKSTKPTEDYDQVKNKLKTIINKKISKTRKKLGGKKGEKVAGKKRFRARK